MPQTKRHYRAIFISDLHLGSFGSQADYINDFLKHHTCDYLYLVGDIVDFWALSRKAYFPEEHVKVLRRILKRSTQNTVVKYIIGNHDEYLRNILPLSIGSIDFADECVHVASDGRQYLVIHGDAFDQVVKYAKWLAWLGDIGYTMLLRSNIVVKYFRSKLGFTSHWSLSAAVKYKVKSAVNFIGQYETAVVKAVREGGWNGVVCGHIHHPEIRDMDGVLYCNTGDWVESCTAMVEHDDGSMHLVHWAEEMHRRGLALNDAVEIVEPAVV